MKNLFQRPELPRAQLGAEELVELGRVPARQVHGRLPFLARHELGRGSMVDVTADTQAYVTGALAADLSTLASLLGVSMDSLSQGADVIFNGLSGLIDNVPVLGQFLSQTLLLGNATVASGLPMPPSLSEGLPGVLENISRALGSRFPASQNRSSLDEARKAIVSQAPPALRSGLSALLGSGVPGVDLVRR